ncbi:hypothetical protein DFH08DRAFT_898689 [Mycena albidolilacea]|uniref:Uncharacterized protein n=1 Tax=Mycena albidolilacea TaxID=1033008 RepID=A0AAD6Z7Y3_9AGAR|nr:hypothetical protein DFH08DRAFT_898689 [Mycena albidolilacea]
MPLTPRTQAIVWAGIFVVDLVSISLFTASAIIHNNPRDWYLIAMPIGLAICAVAAALTSWRWWRVHKAQMRATLPFYAAPPPAVAVR